MVTSQLRELEHHKIIYRKVYPQVPPKVEYSLTKYGQGIIPILKIMQECGTSYKEQLEQANGKANE